MSEVVGGEVTEDDFSGGCRDGFDVCTMVGRAEGFDVGAMVSFVGVGAVVRVAAATLATTTPLLIQQQLPLPLQQKSPHHLRQLLQQVFNVVIHDKVGSKNKYLNLAPI